MPLSEDAFVLRPYTDQCRSIAEEGAHAIIGVSPGNGYFSAQRLVDLAHWSRARFDQVDLVYTDLHVAEMHEAMGYGPDDARRKAVKQLRGVRAKVHRALQAADPSGRRLRARPMSEFAALPAYRQLHQQARDALAADRDVRACCDRLMERFLANRLAPQEAVTARQRQACLDYVCAEVPLFLDTPALLGVPSSLNCYHKALPLAELLYARGPGLRASRNQGHGILTPAQGAP
ncbi:tRNA-dependent cyclodipeptide synthase [Streptomyces sp. NPDC048518]|uniref:tRNA-dependent cyclodipeptide synthase n=1 Tax=Streptomyces sp. NPDC048518 TaxID=3155029 RepID=UPI0033C069F5